MRAAAQDQADAVQVREVAPGQIAVRGRLGFDTARYAHERGIALIDAATAPRIELDCSRITKADSAGLAVLIDWMARARLRGRRLCVTGIPEELDSIARISEVDDLLRQGVDCGESAG
jgi:phospholipid transport system transporter-binding protein